MIIEAIKIENYLCYYDENEFIFTDGLNIILADNGEGKTKFYEAVEWLFKGSTEAENITLISKKKISESMAGDSFKVRVEMIVNEYDERKIISRSFSVNVDGEKSFNIDTDYLAGIVETRNGERSKVDGGDLLKSMFPHNIRRYSMFKGEEELNIFDNKDALINLINEFSDAKFYSKYEELAANLKRLSEVTVEKETRALAKNEQELRNIHNSLELNKREVTRREVLKNDCNESIVKLEVQLNKSSKYFKDSKRLKIHKDRIEEYLNQIEKLKEGIFDEYTNALFDKNWILMHFKNVHKKFDDKISSYSRKRREIQKAYDQKIGEDNQKRKLANSFLPLPDNVPSKSHMEEMINDRVCKVCNTPAPVGSDALKHMQQKLKSFLISQDDLKEEAVEPAFKYNFLNKLVTLRDNQEDEISDLNKIKNNIKKVYEQNTWRSEAINDFDLKIEIEKELISELVGGELEETSLEDVFINFSNWTKDKSDKEKELKYLSESLGEVLEEKTRLEKALDLIQVESATKFSLDSRKVFKNINKIFLDTKEFKFHKFIDQLSDKSNHIFQKINVDSFTGEIKFEMDTSKTNPVKISLEDSDGDIFRANKSLVTSMHISILLAISELSKEDNEQRFPLIFDAPTSSFGEPKMKQFLNLINNIDNQTIILTKDFIGKDSKGEIYIKEEFFSSIKGVNSIWVRLNRPFEIKNLETISTQVKKIKNG
jgi:DNA sulfur modification protein DndD